MWMNKSRRMRWARYVAHTEHMDRCTQSFHDKPQENRPLGRPRHRQRENTKMGLKSGMGGPLD